MQKNKNDSSTTKIDVYQYTKSLLSVTLPAIIVVALIRITFGWYIDSRPVQDKIESQFSITLPTNTRDMQYWSQSPDRYVTLVRFTVDIADLNNTMNSVEYEKEYCIKETRQENYMPDFYVSDTLDWWHPQQAEIFEGISCTNEAERYYDENKHIMVDLSNPSEAVVYIEEFATHYGERYKFD